MTFHLRRAGQKWKFSGYGWVGVNACGIVGAAGVGYAFVLFIQSVNSVRTATHSFGPLVDLVLDSC